MNAKQLLTWLALAVPLVAGFEGVRRTVYADPTNILTVCAGETRGVKVGDTYTHAQCMEMLQSRLLEFNEGVDRCVHVPLSDKTRVALVSFAYNVGLSKFCGSALVAKLNMGERGRACDQLLRWTYAGGRQLPGLVKRRQAEWKLCVDGFNGAA